MIYYVSSGNPHHGSGTKSDPFQTIQQAADIARAGDIVEIGEGVYREWVDPQYGGSSDKDRITYRAAEGAKPIVSGAEAFGEWKAQDNIWVAEIDNRIFSSVSRFYNPFAQEIYGDWFNDFGQVHHTAQVFIDDAILYETDSMEKLTADSEKMRWFAKPDEKTTLVYANFGELNPNEHLTEYSARPSCFFPHHESVNYITVSGIWFRRPSTQWAPPTAFQTGAIGPHWSKGWIIEDCIISDSKCCGISLGKRHDDNDNNWVRNGSKGGTQTYTETILSNSQRGWNRLNVGSHIIRRNHIYNCGQTGIVGCMGAAFSLIEDNHIHNCNDRGEFGGCEMAGIKLHAAIDVTIRRNCIHHCIWGLWLDWEAQGARVSCNSMFANINQDLFIEVCHGPTIVDNNLLLSPVSFLSYSQGMAFVHNFIGGAFELHREMNRFTLYHMPHDTFVHGVTYIYGGDDRFTGNIFAGENTGTFLYDGYSDITEDTFTNINDNQSAGLEMTLPVDIHHNLYLNGAKAYFKERAAMAIGEKAEFSVEQRGNDWYFRAELSENIFSKFVPEVNTDTLGVAFQPNQRFENPDGSDLTVNESFFGGTREAVSAAGPFVQPFTELCLNHN